MARHLWTILCRKAELNSVNNVTLHEVVEEVQVQNPPPAGALGMAPIELNLITNWARQEPGTYEKFEHRVRLRFPEGSIPTEVLALQAEIELKQTRARVIAELGTLPVTIGGTYEFIVDQRSNAGPWTESARLPLDVKVGETSPLVPPVVPK